MRIRARWETAAGPSDTLARVTPRTRALLVFGGFLAFSGLFISLTAGHSTRLTASFHRLYHAAYTSQLVNGIVPPTNPSSLGAPANNYWAWHALLALLSRTLDIPAFQAHLIVSAFSLATFLSALWVLAGRRAWAPASCPSSCSIPSA